MSTFTALTSARSASRPGMARDGLLARSMRSLAVFASAALSARLAERVSVAWQAVRALSPASIAAASVSRSFGALAETSPIA